MIVSGALKKELLLLLLLLLLCLLLLLLLLLWIALRRDERISLEKVTQKIVLKTSLKMAKWQKYDLRLTSKKYTYYSPALYGMLGFSRKTP